MVRVRVRVRVRIRVQPLLVRSTRSKLSERAARVLPPSLHAQPLCADVGGAVEGVIEMDKILQKDFKELQDYIDESVRLYSSPSP